MHAPVARIRGSRIVSYCSMECADRGGEERNRAEPAASRAEPEPSHRPASARAADDLAVGHSRPGDDAQVSADPSPRHAKNADHVSAPEKQGAKSRADRADPRPHRPEPAAHRVAPPETYGDASASGRRPSVRLPSSRGYVDVEAAPAVVRRGRGRGAILIICVLVLAAGVALLVTQVLPARGGPSGAEGGLAGSAAARRAPTTGGAGARSTASVPSVTAATPPAAQAGGMRRDAAAVAELRALMASSSARVRRLAAQALARTGDGSALAFLRRLLREEPSQLGRIQVAYALARAGDAEARQRLRGELDSERRDVRLDAARSLVQLGDDSGRKPLRAMLSVDQHRVGAAGLLARLGDDEGLKVLRAEASDRSATLEARMRAQVALGRAGDTSVAPALHKILSDRRYNVGAADALAALGDAAAGPALAIQLGLNAMRVQAALWLRRLKIDVDPAPLELALRAADEASRVSAAEALLILYGPPSISERD